MFLKFRAANRLRVTCGLQLHFLGGCFLQDMARLAEGQVSFCMPPKLESMCHVFCCQNVGWTRCGFKFDLVPDKPQSFGDHFALKVLNTYSLQRSAGLQFEHWFSSLPNKSTCQKENVYVRLTRAWPTVQGNTRVAIRRPFN